MIQSTFRLASNLFQKPGVPSIILNTKQLQDVRALLSRPLSDNPVSFITKIDRCCIDILISSLMLQATVGNHLIYFEKCS